eukprot:1094527-Rhodomonas_salina.2
MGLATAVCGTVALSRRSVRGSATATAQASSETPTGLSTICAKNDIGLRPDTACCVPRSCSVNLTGWVYTPPTVYNVSGNCSGCNCTSSGEPFTPITTYNVRSPIQTVNRNLTRDSVAE